MNYYIFARPLIGAIIGYVTNFIAVQMMFRPIKPIKIGNFVLPFTPGIIPKNQARLAEAIGNTVSNNLLTQEDLKKVLLSDDIEVKIKKDIKKYIDSLQENNISLEKTICLYIGNENYETILKNIKNNLTNSIYGTVLQANLGQLVAEQIQIASMEKIKGSILGIVGGKSIVSSITSQISEKLNKYIEINGKNIIAEMVEKEFNKYTSKTISELCNSIHNSNIDLTSAIMNIYENIVSEKLSNFLNTINISKMIQDKINSMDILELEKLILLIMKKELNALVNLGAVIGLILGMLNLLF